MIVLDTNVLSEPLRPRPSDEVIDWLAGLREPAAITAITVAEILRGVQALPDGRRRAALAEGIDDVLRAFRHDVLVYDDSAAKAFADLATRRAQAGRPLSVEAGMIAAICMTRGAALATRNTADFDGLGIVVVNPWEPRS